jgi:hypothetical protein
MLIGELFVRRLTRLTRLIGSPGLAAIVAVPLFWSASPSPHDRLARPAATTAIPRTIAGNWSFLFGNFSFDWIKARDGYTDRVIQQRLGVFCPQVNDQDGQIVLHRVPDRTSKDPMYTGTWKWFYTGSCKFAGYGGISITLWRTGDIATVVAEPPAAVKARGDTFRITRLG